MINPILKEDLAGIIAHKDINWNKLKHSTVMVTGANGMVGSYLVRTMLTLNEVKNMNIQVVCVVRNKSKLPEDILNHPSVTAICHDVSQPFFYEGELDYLVHAASPASPLIMREKPVETIAANTLGTFYTLQLAQQKQAKGYLFISSREIYGEPDDKQEYFYEHTYGFVDPLDPRSCYPEGKKAAETICASFRYQYGLDAKSARLAHTYGPGMSIDDGRVQADFLKNALYGEDIILKSEGLAVRTYTYISDVITGLWYILLNGEESVYNIGDENGKTSIRELAQLIADLDPEKHLTIQFKIENSKSSGCAPFTKGILSSKKLRELGWLPDYTLETGFKRTLRFLEIERRTISNNKEK